MRSPPAGLAFEERFASDAADTRLIDQLGRKDRSGAARARPPVRLQRWSRSLGVEFSFKRIGPPATAGSAAGMAKERSELLVEQVEVGVGDLEASTDDGVKLERVVVEHVRGSEPHSGQQREVLLVYRAQEVADLAEQLRLAADQAAAQA